MNNDILLSFCLSGRNDDYGTNFKKRLQITLNYLAYNVFRLGMESKIEIVMTDWNSDSPLGNALALSNEAIKLTNFVAVPNSLAKSLNHSKSNYSSCYAENISFRRGRGKYICYMQADNIISIYVLERLVNLLYGKLPLCFDLEKSCIGIPRKYIAPEVDDAIFADDFRKLDKFIQLAAFYMPFDDPSPGMNRSFGGILAHRDIYAELRGFNTVFSGWGGSDEDLGLRANKNYPLINLGPMGVYFYDYTPERKAIKTKIERMTSCSTLFHEVNDEKWGMANRELITYKGGACPEIVTAAVDRLTAQELNDALVCSDFRNEMAYLRKNILHRHLLPLTAPAIVAGRIAGLGRTKKYLEISGAACSGAVAVSLLNKFSEIYLVEAEGEEEKNTFSYFSDISYSLYYLKHQGFVRMVTGCPVNGLERLEKSFSGTFSFDLILCKVIDEKRLCILDKTVEILSQDGSIILCADNLEMLKKATARVNARKPEFSVIISDDLKTAVISRLMLSPEIAGKAKKAWHPFNLTLVVRLMALRGEKWRRLKLLCYFLLQNKIMSWPSLLKYLYKRVPR